MTSEEIIALLNAPGSDDVYVSVQRMGSAMYRIYETGPCELAFSDDHTSLLARGECFDFRGVSPSQARDTLRELRRLLNDPRVVAELERRDFNRTKRPAA